MKKLVLTSMAMVLGAVLAHAQGTVSINIISAVAETNGIATAPAGGSLWNYELLDMTAGAYSNLTSSAQTSAYSLGSESGANLTAAIGLWTDSTISGIGQNLGSHAGGINSSGSVAGNWAAPSSNAGYNTAPNWDYYTILGWNSSAGSWATVLAALQAGTPNGGAFYFGQTGVAFNYAGGGPGGLGAVTLFGASPTGLAGSGGLPTTGALILNTVPEPTTLALAGLGGISMLFLRRRKA